MGVVVACRRGTIVDVVGSSWNPRGWVGWDIAAASEDAVKVYREEARVL